MIRNRTHLIIGSALALVLLVIGGIVFAVTVLGKQEVSTHEPVDIVFDFYRPWLEAAQATTTDPYQAGLAKAPILGKELRAKIRAAQKEGGLDPVLCQTTPPEDVALRVVVQSEVQSEILVTARRSTSTEQAIVTLLPLRGGWYINDIRCSPGEFAPEREFSFDTEGYILKSVPEPLNPEYWHLVFEENGKEGHYVPLFFSVESTCVAQDGVTEACVPDNFRDASKAHVKGQMTELGVNVARLEFKR